MAKYSFTFKLKELQNKRIEISDKQPSYLEQRFVIFVQTFIFSWQFFCFLAYVCQFFRDLWHILGGAGWTANKGYRLGTYLSSRTNTQHINCQVMLLERIRKMREAFDFTILLFCCLGQQSNLLCLLCLQFLLQSGQLGLKFLRS